jgi:hypothetical protein
VQAPQAGAEQDCDDAGFGSAEQSKLAGHDTERV